MVALLAILVFLLASAVLKTTRALLAARDGFEDHRSFHGVARHLGPTRRVGVDEGRAAELPLLLGSI